MSTVRTDFIRHGVRFLNKHYKRFSIRKIHGCMGTIRSRGLEFLEGSHLPLPEMQQEFWARAVGWVKI